VYEDQDEITNLIKADDGIWDEDVDKNPYDQRFEGIAIKEINRSLN
jgi:hypothetical protein